METREKGKGKREKGGGDFVIARSRLLRRVTRQSNYIKQKRKYGLLPRPPKESAHRNDKIYVSGFWLLASAMLAAIFIAFPQIDLFVSGLFYKEGSKFYLNENPILMFLHNSVTYITISMVVLWIGLIVATGIKKKPIWDLSRLRVLYLLLVLAIGPGLVVNALFKDNWGRARPSTIEEFGGKKHFTPAFFISDQCDKNCSFVSGDPSVGFYFLALALAIPQKRKLFTCFGLGLGTVFSATRIMQGGHFLSDTIFSGIFTFTVAYLLYIALLKLEAKTCKVR